MLSRMFVVCILLCSFASAQVREVVELAYAADLVSRISHTWNAYERWKVAALGDINGDMFDDFVCYENVRNGAAWPVALRVVLGTNQFPQEVRGDDLRQIRIVFPEDYRIFYPQLESYGSAGDFDRDGYCDILIGSPSVDWQETEDTGLVLLIHGGPALPGVIALDDVLRNSPPPGVRTLTITSTEANLAAGRFVTQVGDLNGDGYDDIAIGCGGGYGTQNGGPHAGRLYVIYGGYDTASGVIHLPDVGGAVPGFVVRGAFGDDGAYVPGPGLHLEGDQLGASPCGIGDINGDGYEDLAVSAPRASRDGLDRAGLVYVIFGGPDLPSEIAPEDTQADPSSASTICAPPFASLVGSFGDSIGRAGDVNGDGLGDLLIGGADSPVVGVIRSLALLVYGSTEWQRTYDSTNFASLDHALIESTPPPFLYQDAYTGFGLALDGIGDWNRDGFDDFLITAPWEPSLRDAGSRAGRAYVVYGASDLPRRMCDVEIALTIPGLVINSENSLLHLGYTACGDGDFDGNGRRDILLAAPFWKGDCREIRWGDGDSYVYILWGARDPTFTVDAVVPSFSSITGNCVVTLKGRNFSGEESVSFGGVQAADIRAVSTAELRCVVPPGAKVGPVEVQASRAGQVSRLAEGFSYRRPPVFSNIDVDQELLAGGSADCVVVQGLFPQGLPKPWYWNLARAPRLSFGDFDGDGFDDLAIGQSNQGDLFEGQILIVFGRADAPPVIHAGEDEYRAVVIDGRGGMEGFGAWVTVPGDINGDGFDDLITQAGFPGSSTAETYVLFGRELWQSRLAIADEVAMGHAVARLSNETAYSCSAGDLDNDTMTDFLMTTPPQRPEAGVSFFYGHSSVNAGMLEPAGRIINPEFEGFGRNATGIGDVNGDGWNDVVVGPYPGVSAINRAFILLGGPGGFRSDILVSDLASEGRLVQVQGQDTDVVGKLGEHVDSCGDFNGDGLADMLITDPLGGRDFEGTASILLGHRDLGQTIDMIDLRVDTERRVVIHGEFAYDQNFYATGVGDINGDGFSDIAIPGHPWSGMRHDYANAYVIFGGAAPGNRIYLGDLNGYDGFKLTGGTTDVGFGPMVGGDFNGDRIDDLAVGVEIGNARYSVVVLGNRQNGPFVRGDANASGKIDIADAVFLLSHLFARGPTPRCGDAGDANDDGRLDIADAIKILAHLFANDGPLFPPFGECGIDQTPDSLGCSSFPPCDGQ